MRVEAKTKIIGPDKIELIHRPISHDEEIGAKKVKTIRDKCKKINRITPAALGCIKHDGKRHEAIEILKHTYGHLQILLTNLGDDEENLNIIDIDFEVKK